AGNLTVATMLSCTLSADHRVIDGAAAAGFLQSLREYIEHPASILR
ncbi:MAG: 2-oxo acid dehydrogenase subunit E2, partial [Parvibaculales bacterium]